MVYFKLFVEDVAFIFSCRDANSFNALLYMTIDKLAYISVNSTHMSPATYYCFQTSFIIIFYIFYTITILGGTPWE